MAFEELTQRQGVVCGAAPFEELAEHRRSAAAFFEGLRVNRGIHQPRAYLVVIGHRR